MPAFIVPPGRVGMHGGVPRRGAMEAEALGPQHCSRQILTVQSIWRDNHSSHQVA